MSGQILGYILIGAVILIAGACAIVPLVMDKLSAAEKADMGIKDKEM
jgi:hypothetical protein